MSEVNYSWFQWLFRLLVLASFGWLLVNVFKLDVIQHQYFSGKARDNKVAEMKIPASRGKILDRKGREIAKSVYQYFQNKDGSKVYEGSGEFMGNKFEGKDLAFELKRQYYR